MTFVLRCEIPVDLVVKAELLGKQHRFVFEGREICVSLPEQCYCPFDSESDREHEKIARCVSWKCAQCLEVAINKIFLSVTLIEQDHIQVTEDMVQPELQTIEIFWDKNTENDFRDNAKKVSEIATRAFEYWCRVVRWNTRFAFVGLPLEGQDLHAGWRYLASVDPLKYIASFNDVLVINSIDGMSVDDWIFIQETLKNGNYPPLWIDAYHDARRRLRIGDVRGAYLETAICLESFLRKKIEDALAPLPKEETAIRNRMSRWGMSDIITNLDKVSTLRDLSIFKGTIKELFKKRDAIMHGKKVQLDASSLNSILSNAKTIIYT